ncbi:negative regulatory protein YxlE [Siminovitchia terrae]|uniref:Negative regulatory protein YxlE n=1 Tax=Siminovitchia terrae TaxID=1914933 RepID=A0A429X0I6_SIMTE|nr:PLDc N-terminal domain-containing protein [Siminovitchia terrae]RST57014.1 transcriptional regulator [Siminovitchia terrae]GIN94042.1 negative regulatory protein YxlE [Siminovitchia terrae]GIN98750.1 negative regulatory protein YxlE [Siminovitchia terrae]
MDIPWGLIAPIVILDLILKITALVSCIKEENTNGTKWVWILIILFLNLIGPVLYFVIGRKKQ